MYHAFPNNARILLESGVAVGTLAAVVLNALFNHLRPRLYGESEAAKQAPCDGPNGSSGGDSTPEAGNGQRPVHEHRSEAIAGPSHTTEQERES